LLPLSRLGFDEDTTSGNVTLNGTFQKVDAPLLAHVKGLVKGTRSKRFVLPLMFRHQSGHFFRLITSPDEVSRSSGQERMGSRVHLQL
jgi:hypothetical protein